MLGGVKAKREKMKKPTDIIIKILLLGIVLMFSCCFTGTYLEPDGFIESNIVTDRTEVKLSDYFGNPERHSVSLYENEYRLIHNIRFFCFENNDEIRYFFVETKYGKQLFSDIMSVKKRELWPDENPDEIIILTVEKEAFSLSDKTAKIRVSALYYPSSETRYMFIAIAVICIISYLFYRVCLEIDMF